MKKSPTKKSDLVRAVTDAKTPDEIRSLLFVWKGKVHHALEIIASHARAWDDALVQLVLVEGFAPRFLLANPHRPKNTETLLATWSVNRLLAEDVKVTVEAAASRLLGLAKSGDLPITGEVCREIMTGLKPKRDSMAYRQVEAARMLLQHPEADDCTLTEILDITGSKIAPELVPAIVLHSAATREIRKRALYSVETRQLAGGIAEPLFKPEWVRRDPDLRPRLVEIALLYRLPAIRAVMIEDANPADCAVLFRRHVEQDRDSAGWVFVRAGAKVAPLLRRDDITPYLEHKHRDVREAAIAALSQATVISPPHGWSQAPGSRSL